MTALEHLEALLQRGIEPTLARPWSIEREIDTHIAQLKAHLKNTESAYVPRELQEEAVRRFWANKRLDTLKDTRLVSFGIAMPIGPRRLRVIEDKERFPMLLQGVDQYLSAPARYRRCYQGLLSGYFAYDPEDSNPRTAGRENWKNLRHYLHTRADKILGGVRNPLWAETLQHHTTLFGDNPAVRYGPGLLSGNSAEVDELREVLNISVTSWFMRKLYLAQIHAAVQKSDPGFLELLSRVLDLLRDNELIRDEGLALVLNRFAQLSAPVLALPLRDAAVNWWGNPWLQSNSMRWGRVSAEARAMVTEWLKLEFIETFFTLLTEEKSGDTRRLEFWKRYVNVIDEIHFALGAEARNARSPDFVVLRKRMSGLVTPLLDSAKANNAFIMRMGSIVVVEFSGYSNACYGYDAKISPPFEYDKPMVMRVDAKNSLKHSSRDLWLSHQDGTLGYRHWEERFKDILATRYDLRPKSMPESQATIPRMAQQAKHEVPIHAARINDVTETLKASAAPTKAPPGQKRTPSIFPDGNADPDAWNAVSYSRKALHVFARAFHFTIVDLTDKNGNLWVRTNDYDPAINAVLCNWGFEFRNVSKGWWKAR